MRDIEKSRDFEIQEVMNNLDIFGNNRIMIVDDEEFCISSLKNILNQTKLKIDGMLDICLTG